MRGDEPTSNNPFIRFKQHVDSRIGTGLSVVTGGSISTEPAATSATTSDHPRTHTANMNSGPPKPPAQPPSWIKSLLGWQSTSYDVPQKVEARQWWIDWAQLSPYAPHNLRDLDPPVPAHVPEEDAHLFDFGDAFEDLLAATQGLPMMDLRQRAARKRHFQRYRPAGEPPVLWVNRLSAKGLLPEPLPPRSEDMTPHEMSPSEALLNLTVQYSKVLEALDAQQAQQERHMNTMAPQAQQDMLRNIAAKQQAQLEELRNAMAQREQTDGRMSREEQLVAHVKGLREKLLQELDQDITFNPATMFRQVEDIAKSIGVEIGNFDPTQLFRQAEEVLNSFDKECKKLSQAGKQMSESGDFDFERFLNGDETGAATKRAPKAQDQQKPQPETEAEHFLAVFGALMEADASARHSGKDNTLPTGAKDVPRYYTLPAPVETKVEENNENGGKTVRWSMKTFLPSGAVQVHTIVQTLDAQGNEISRKTSFFSEKPETNKQESWTARRQPDASGNDNGSSGVQKFREERVDKPVKSTGWFWK